MRTKNFVILIFTILFLLMSGLFLFFQISETGKNIDKEVEEILKTIEKEIQTGYIKNETINSFKKDLFYIIWIKNVNNNEWYPLIYDKFNFKDPSIFVERDPNKIPEEFNSKIKLLKYSIDEISFIVWINRYSVVNILKNIILPILIIILIYLIILLIINIFFGVENVEDDTDYIEYYNEKKLINRKELKKETPRMMPEITLSEEDIQSDYYEEEEDDDDEKEKEKEKPYKTINREKKVIDNKNNKKDYVDLKDHNNLDHPNLKNVDKKDLYDKLSYELTSDEVKNLLLPIDREPENINKNNEKILQDYKELWYRHFKTSESFKSDFPFLKLYNTIKFGITPEDYIENGFEVVSSYFKWKDPQIYIKQRNFFVSTKTKEIIDHEYIDIPAKGDRKGDIFIPLFPYNDTIFGYLYFYWDENENFNIADIIFFLKFFFSEDAKFIFLNYDNIEKTMQNINKLLNEGNKIFVSIISIDNKEKLKETLSANAKELLENMINEKLHNEFLYFEIFNISNFTFGIYSIYENEEEIIKKFDSFTKTKSMYDLPEHRNITLTFSLGITFSEIEENPNAEFLIENSNMKLKNALAEGGNKVVF